MRNSLPTYNMKNEWQQYLSAQIPTIGLSADQRRSGVVEGSTRYDHNAVHRPLSGEEPTYDNVYRNNFVPAILLKLTEKSDI